MMAEHEDEMEKGEMKPESKESESNENEPKPEEYSEPTKGESNPEQAMITDKAKRRRNIGFLVAALIAIGLIVGLSVGLTLPNNSASSASLDEGQNPTTGTGTNTPPANSNSAQDQPIFQSVNRAYNVTLRGLSPAVLEGYSDMEELRDDLGQAVRFFINNFIEEQIRWGRYSYGVMESMDDATVSDGALNSGGKGESAKGVTDFETNNQNDGVDEADKVKSDGTYVYAAYGDTLVVWEAATGTFVTNYTLPAPKSSPWSSGYYKRGMKAAASDAMEPYTPSASIEGLSLEGDVLVVYATGYGGDVVAAQNISSACEYDAYATRLLFFDISPPLTLITQKDIHGFYRDARAIGSDIHLVTTCSFNFYSLTESLYISSGAFVNMTDDQYRVAAAKAAEPLIDDYVTLMIQDMNAHGTANIPKVSLWSSQFGNNSAVVELANSGGAIQAFTRLTSFSIANLDAQVDLSSAGAYTPSGWGYTYVIDGWVVLAEQGWQWNEDLDGTSESTHLIGFSINGVNATPAILGSMPGYILNQYALSIHQGHLRVATTIQSWISEVVNSTNSSNGSGSATPEVEDWWPVFTSVTKNQIIILKIPTAEGKMLEEVSRISNLGKDGETITAINYFGLIAYVVTFLQTDPFYVVDLNPSSPEILGELQISGFSQYLHSINKNDTLLVATGQEADEEGMIQGLKISLFDASDPASPVQLHSAAVELDEDTWSSSEATFDYKAFRWLSLGDGVGLAILPVRIESWSLGADGNYDGFYVYDVSRKGISLRFNVSHVDSENFFGCYSSAQLPQRSMVFNGNLTTMKGHSVLSTDLDSGEQRWKFELPKPATVDMCMVW